MFDTRNNLSHQVVSEIQTHFGDKVFKSIIPRNVRLSEAPSHGRSIIHYDNKSVGAIKYVELAQELDQQVYGKIESTEPAAQKEQGESLANESLKNNINESINISVNEVQSGQGGVNV
jgi:chromosome partitioning protein